MRNHDYGAAWIYYVTLVTEGRNNYLSKIISGNTAKINLSKIGLIANQYWLDIPKHYPFVQLDEYVIMPNHIHGLLYFNKPEHEYRIQKPNTFGPQSMNLAAVIRGYKSALKTYATTNEVPFGWQPRYYDSVVRSEEDLNKIRSYIRSNPAKWVAEGKIDKSKN